MSLPAKNARSSDRLMAIIVCATVLLVGTAVSLPVPAGPSRNAACPSLFLAAGGYIVRPWCSTFSK